MQSKLNTKLLLNKTKETFSDIIDSAPYKLGYFIMGYKDSDSINEDSLFIIEKDNSFIFGVSDGAGGHPKGADASDEATKSITENFLKTDSPDFIEMFNLANQKVLDLKVGARCTLSLGYIQDNFFSCHSTGDSEIIYWNANGKEIYSNIPHSEVGYLIESGALEQEESLDDPNRYLVANLIGDSAIRIESTSKMEVKKGHTILIGSDGIFDNISHQQLTEIIAKGSFEESFKELISICISQDPQSWKKPDDISFVVVRKK